MTNDEKQIIIGNLISGIYNDLETLKQNRVRGIDISSNVPYPSTIGQNLESRFNKLLKLLDIKH